MGEFLNMDCMEGMAQFEDNHFDLAIVDPPYGIEADEKQNNAALQRIKANGKTKAGRGWQLYKQTKWDKTIPDDQYFKELQRVSDNQIVWGGNYMTKYLPPSMGWVVWNKGQRDFSLADGELAWSSFNKALRIVDISRGFALAESDRVHPTQKPIRLYKWLLKNYAKDGDLILDTHVGSASSLIACEDMGFDYVGYEIDTDYYNAAQKRLEQSRQQLKLVFG